MDPIAVVKVLRQRAKARGLSPTTLSESSDIPYAVAWRILRDKDPSRPSWDTIAALAKALDVRVQLYDCVENKVIAEKATKGKDMNPIYKIDNCHLNLFHLTTVGPLQTDKFFITLAGGEPLEVSFIDAKTAEREHAALLAAWKENFPVRIKHRQNGGN